MQMAAGCADDDEQVEKLCHELERALFCEIKEELSDIQINAGEDEGSEGINEGGAVDCNGMQLKTTMTRKKKQEAGFRALDGGPVLMDAMNKSVLHPTDSYLGSKGKNLIQGVFREGDDDDFSLMSEKDAAKLKKQQEKAVKIQRAAYEAHKEQVKDSLSSKPVEVIRNEGGPAFRDVHLRSISVSNGGPELIGGCDIVLAYGRKYGLIGRNGSGKTTFLRAFSERQFAGIPPNCQVLHVEQEIAGDDATVIDTVLSCDTERERLLKEEEVLLKFEDDDNDKNQGDEAKTEKSKRLEEISKRLHDIDAYTAESRAASILAGLSFTKEMQKRKTSSLSGGWRMRVALARSLFVQPDVLLLDEPTNHLDLNAVLWLQGYLIKWPKTVIIVSHAREFLNAVCTDIIYLHSRKLSQYRGNYDSFVKTKDEQMKNERAMVDGLKSKISHMQEFVEKFRYNANRAALVQSRVKAIAKLEEELSGIERPEEKEKEIHLNFNFPDPQDGISPPIISFNDVSFWYDTVGEEKKRVLYEKLSFGIDLSTRVAIVGGNGAGKSTLLGLISGTLEAKQGHIFRNPKVRIALFSQHHVDGLDLALTPLQYMAACFPDAKEHQHRSHLASFGVDAELANQAGYTLSGGQKSRVALAKITWTKPHILLLDEPSNHLDIDAIDALIKGLEEFKGGIIIVSHDQYLIEKAIISHSPTFSSTRTAGKIWCVTNNPAGSLQEITGLERFKEEYVRKIMDQ